jgi:exonuclease III
MISIFTLNLWRYYDFDSRKQKIIKFLKKNDPDIIFLQEVQINQGFSPFSQVELIKKFYQIINILFSTIY